MDQLAPKRAAVVKLLLRSAENRGRGGADVQDLARGNRNGPYDVRQRGHDAAQPLSKRLEFLFRLAPGGSLFRFPQRPLHRRSQANEVVFQNVVGGAALERVDGGFLADRSGIEKSDRITSGANSRSASTNDFSPSTIRWSTCKPARPSSTSASSASSATSSTSRILNRSVIYRLLG